MAEQDATPATPNQVIKRLLAENVRLNAQVDAVRRLIAGWRSSPNIDSPYWRDKCADDIDAALLKARVGHVS